MKLRTLAVSMLVASSLPALAFAADAPPGRHAAGVPVRTQQIAAGPRIPKRLAHLKVEDAHAVMAMEEWARYENEDLGHRYTGRLMEHTAGVPAGFAQVKLSRNRFIRPFVKDAVVIGNVNKADLTVDPQIEVRRGKALQKMIDVYNSDGVTAIRTSAEFKLVVASGATFLASFLGLPPVVSGKLVDLAVIGVVAAAGKMGHRVVTNMTTKSIAAKVASDPVVQAALQEHMAAARTVPPAVAPAAAGETPAAAAPLTPQQYQARLEADLAQVLKDALAR